MPSAEGQWISACRLFQLPNRHAAHSEVSGFITDFAGCCNHSNSYKRYKHPSGRPGRGIQCQKLSWVAGQPRAAAPKVNIVLTVRRTDGTLPSSTYSRNRLFTVANQPRQAAAAAKIHQDLPKVRASLDVAKLNTDKIQLGTCQQTLKIRTDFFSN